LHNFAASERRNSDEANFESQLEPNGFYTAGQAPVATVINVEK
jgi:hypothetical protein